VTLDSLRLRALLVAAVTMIALAVSGSPALTAMPRAVVVPSEVSLVAGINDTKDPNIAVLEFLPAKAKVAKGTMVTWEFAGPESHSVTFVRPGTAFRTSGRIGMVGTSAPPKLAV